MPKIAFYRQQRRDGGVRMGLDFDGYSLVEAFEDRTDDPDPVLDWFIDVRAEGRRLPRDVAGVQRWLIDESDSVRSSLRAFAEELRVGMDPDIWPLVWPVAEAPRGVKMQIVCSASRRSQGLELGKQLVKVADHWEDYLARLNSHELAGR